MTWWGLGWSGRSTTWKAIGLTLAPSTVVEMRRVLAGGSAMITMTDDGPRISNVLLNGILDKRGSSKATTPSSTACTIRPVTEADR